MIERTEARFGLKPQWLAADTAYGSAANLDWLVNEKRIAPHIPVIDKSKREDGTFSREDFTFDKERRRLYLPGRRDADDDRSTVSTDHMLRYLALRPECRAARSKRNAARKCPRAGSIATSTRTRATLLATLAKTKAYEQSRRDRKKVEMLFAHLKRILRLGRLRLRGPRGAQFEFTLAAIAQNLRRLAKLVARPPPVASVACSA